MLGYIQYIHPRTATGPFSYFVFILLSVIGGLNRQFAGARAGHPSLRGFAHPVHCRAAAQPYNYITIVMIDKRTEMGGKRKARRKRQANNQATTWGSLPMRLEVPVSPLGLRR